MAEEEKEEEEEEEGQGPFIGLYASLQDLARSRE